jgi:hypothetical protein
MPVEPNHVEIDSIHEVETSLGRSGTLGFLSGIIIGAAMTLGANHVSRAPEGG